MSSRASIALLLCLLAPAARATTVGPLQTLDASPAGATQRSPQVSWDGTRYVVVWEDGRSPAVGAELYLARIDTAGALVDRNGIALLSPVQPGDQTQPAIAYDPSGHFLIAWSDPRAGIADIFVARFFGDNAFLPEPGGTAVTDSPAEPESRPAVACALQSCLVAYTRTTGPTTEIRGSRVYPSGDLQDINPLDLVSGAAGTTSELAPAVTATSGAFFVAWEDDRNRASGQLGADLFMRTVPDLGMVSPVVGSALSSAAFRQSGVSLGSISATQYLAVWQDQRAGTSTTIGEDSYRARFTLNLNPAGAEAALLAIPRAQLSPKLAARNGSGLVVWQDFRTGVFGGTYASRVDAQGNALDAGGFPLILQSANVIEHAVVRGPGSDYLVLAVRSTPAPARILYRLVRDEPPAGLMMGVGTLQAAADGVAAASVSFGLARGQSGLPVVDGTLYTVSLSSAEPTLLVTDVDPTRPGVQVGSVNGELTVGLRSLRPETVTVSVASVEGTSTGSAMVVFQNVAPTVSAVEILPALPRSDQDLLLSYVYADINSDPESGTIIQWTRDGMVQSGFANQRMIPASATLRREVWRASVRASDGHDFSPFAFSPPVTILNTPPAAFMVHIDPPSGVKTNTALSAVYRYGDPDNDIETGSVLRWYLNGAEDASLQDQRAVPATRVTKGQRWGFTIVPHDGTDPGPLVASATVAVENSVPVARAGANGNVTERRRYTLDGSASSDADPQDTLSYAWSQTAGPTVTLSGTSTAGPSFLAPSVEGTTQLEFALTVSDGESTSVDDRVVVLIDFVPDPDQDGLDNEEEAMVGTDPAQGDTDRDGLKDGEEVHTIHSDPLDEDSDDDGVRDGAETEPGADSDGDTLVNALDPDSDGDGVFDGTELGVTSAPTGTDLAAMHFTADADRTTTTDPTKADTDGDQLPDGVEDQNHNGKIDLGESDPLDPLSTVGCMPDRSCPSGQSCIGDACRPLMADAGLTCTPLSSRNQECCIGGCAGSGVPTPAICDMPGRVEHCSANAVACPIGACQKLPADNDDPACDCSSTGGGSWRDAGALACGILALAWRRRRRGPKPLVR